MALHVEEFTATSRDEWDAFVARSKNGTFLFARSYMDYHADRFRDCSLLVRDDDGRLLALLPAERVGPLVRSHGGLSYGGLVVDSAMTASRMLSVLEGVAEFLGAAGAAALLYKTVPSIYHRQPAEEDLYALFRVGARLVRRDVLSVLESHRRGPVQERRARAVRKARGRGVEVRASTDFEGFWRLLEKNLEARHGVSPVHTVAEMEYLATRFPGNIALHAAYRGTSMIAGAVLYLSADVCHVQYNVAAPEGFECGALDLVLEVLIEEQRDLRRYFDFGASTEQGGLLLNEGLASYKEGFGARTVVHDFYELDLPGGAS